jgi:hypothetical protein
LGIDKKAELASPEFFSWGEGWQGERLMPHLFRPYADSIARAILLAILVVPFLASVLVSGSQVQNT